MLGGGSSLGVDLLPLWSWVRFPTQHYFYCQVSNFAARRTFPQAMANLPPLSVNGTAFASTASTEVSTLPSSAAPAPAPPSLTYAEFTAADSSSSKMLYITRQPVVSRSSSVLNRGIGASSTVSSVGGMPIITPAAAIASEAANVAAAPPHVVTGASQNLPPTVPTVPAAATQTLNGVHSGSEAPVKREETTATGATRVTLSEAQVKALISAAHRAAALKSNGLASAAASNSALPALAPSTTAASAPKPAVYDRLMSALRTALSEVCKERSIDASSEAQEQV